MFTKRSISVYPLIILQALLIGFTNIAGKYGASNIDPYVISFLRYIIGTVTLYIILRISGKKLKIDWKDFRILFVLMFFGMLINQVLFAQALKFTVPSHPSLIYATTPVWVMLIAVLRKTEKINTRIITASFISILGVVIVLGKSLLVFNQDILLGDALILIATLCWSIYTAFSKEMVHKYGPLQLTFILLLGASIIYFPWGLSRFLQIDLAAVSIKTWASIAYMGIFTSGFAYINYFAIIKMIDPSRTGLIISLHPPTTIVLSILFGYEVFQWNIALGTCLILAALWFANHRKNKVLKS